MVPARSSEATGTWHILFDLDGTLTDPAPGITGCIAHALTMLGREAPPTEALLSCIGPPLQSTFPILLNEPPENSPLTDQAIAHYRERFARVGMYENRVYAGIPELLALLQEDGCGLYVATSKPVVFAREIIRHFGLAPYFAGVYGSELSGERTDKAELIAYLLEREGIRPEAAVMVGDRKYDIVGAASCGLSAKIGVGYGYGGADELHAAGADAVCDSVADLATLLKRLRGTRPDGGASPFH